MAAFRNTTILLLYLSASLLMGCHLSESTREAEEEGRDAMSEPKHAGFSVVKTEAEWRKLLTPEQFEIARRKGTEPPFSGQYWDTKTPGTYTCAACGAPLFSSSSKYDSGSGWPSFWAPVSEDAVTYAQDGSLLMPRTEILCARCGAHLGHVFDDGPQPTGLRYCVNSAVLKLEPEPSSAGESASR